MLSIIIKTLIKNCLLSLNIRCFAREVIKNLKKTAILSLTSLVVLCASVGQILFSFASLTPARTIAASGIIIENAVKSIRKLLVAYGISSPLSQNFIMHMAKFDLIDTDFRIGPDVEKIKAINPGIIILGYNDVMGRSPNSEDWSEVDQHEDWFVHDVDGNRLQNKHWGWYCMDVGNQGWREHYANYVREKIDLYGFDGVFADDVWSHLFKDAWTVPLEKVPDYPDWHHKMIEFLRHVKSRVGSKLLIVNTPNNSDYVDVADGKMEEHFAFKSFSSQTPIDNIDALFQISGRDKYYLASPHNMPEDTEKNMLYALCCFLLGVNGPNAYFSWRNVWSEPSHGYRPEFDVSLGSPANEYYLIGSVYARDFEKGKVLVNPTRSSYTFSLEENYKTLGGQVVSNVTLAANTAIILLRV